MYVFCLKEKLSIYVTSCVYFVTAARDRDIILSALSHYEEKTCLRFYEQTDEPDYLVFFRGAG